MKTFLTGVVIGILAGLVACTAPTPPPAASAPTLAATTPAVLSPTPPPTTAPPTAAPPTDTALPAPTHTRRPAITLTASLTPAPSATAAPSDTATPVRVFITYQDFEILPAVTTLKAGTPVTFLIRAGLLVFHQPYNFTAPNVFEAPANLGDGAAYNFTFTEPGTVTLLCGYHPDMRATLIVEP